MSKRWIELKDIAICDRKIFDRHLAIKQHRLSAYTFENIYLWRKLFSIKWAVIDGSLCVFFRDKIGCFLYLPPLARYDNFRAIEESFAITDEINRNKEISRIENIEEEESEYYRKAGFILRQKYPEYLCLSKEQAELKGNGLKHKRWAYNYFTKNYKFDYSPFVLKDKKECLKLYQQWALQRKSANSDHIYLAMMQDSYKCLEVLLSEYKDLSIIGKVVRLDKKIRAFTFGFAVNKEIFCVFFEITDLMIKGLAQFIFSELCKEIKEYKYVNIMDDSGLENLKRVKLSYRPLELIKAYIAGRHE